MDEIKSTLMDGLEDVYKAMIPTPDERERMTEAAVGFAKAKADGDRKEAGRWVDTMNLVVADMEMRTADGARVAAGRVFIRLLGLAASFI